MQLYQIANEYQQALNLMVDEETGEINEKSLEQLNQLSTDFQEKGVAIASYIRNIEADVTAIKDERNKLAARQKLLENRISRIKEYLKYNMENCGISEITCPYFSIRLRKCPPAVQLDCDAESLDTQYVNKKVTYSADKVALKKALQGGAEINGVSLVVNNTVQIK